MTLETLTGIIRFKIAGQAAMPKWAQTAVADALAKADSPPESLRFQCRIATDAQENLALIKLSNGETLTLHHKARPQFGKNSHGQAYLTATMTYSGDGESYTLRWTGDGVPPKMQEVAVKHDKGLAVKPTVVALNLANAEIQPSWQFHKKTPAKARDYEAEDASRDRNKPKHKRSKRSCARLTDADLVTA